MRLNLLVLMLLTAAAPVQAQPFVMSASSTVTPGFYSHAIGDFDGNGMADVVQTAYTQVGIFLNPGTSNLPTTPPPALHGSGLFPPARVGDFNGDGALDLAFFGSNGTTVSFQIMLGDGLGGLGAPIAAVSFAPQQVPADGLVGDFNGDGTDDVCFMRLSATSSSADVWLSTWSSATTGPWTPSVSVASTGFARAAPADVNGDGYDDLVTWILTPQAQSVDVRLGSTSGPAASPTTVPFALPASIRTFGDLNGDAAADMVVNDANGFAVRFGGSALPFASSVAIPSPPVFTASARVADSDGDGNQDVLLSSATGGIPKVHYLVRGDGAGGFGAIQLVATTPTSWGFQRGDLDGDGDLDIFAFGGSSASTGVQVYRNDAIYSDGCSGTTGVPTFDIGAPIPGNASFALSVGSALPGAVAVLGLSLAREAAIAPCGGVQIDLSQLLIDPSSLTTTTDAQGRASFPLPLPNDPGIVGITVYAQWGVVDPLGSLTTGFGNLATSPARALSLF